MMTLPKMIGHGEIVSRHRADANSKPHSGTVDKGSGHSDRGSRRHDRRSGQSPNPGSSRHKEESMGAKLMARKEWEKKVQEDSR